MPYIANITKERIDVKCVADPEKLDLYKKKLTEYMREPQVSVCSLRSSSARRQ